VSSGEKTRHLGGHFLNWGCIPGPDQSASAYIPKGIWYPSGTQDIFGRNVAQAKFGHYYRTAINYRSPEMTSVPDAGGQGVGKGRPTTDPAFKVAAASCRAVCGHLMKKNNSRGCSWQCDLVAKAKVTVKAKEGEEDPLIAQEYRSAVTGAYRGAQAYTPDWAARGGREYYVYGCIKTALSRPHMPGKAALLSALARNVRSWNSEFLTKPLWAQTRPWVGQVGTGPHSACSRRRDQQFANKSSIESRA